ncbi:subtilisin-like protease SBT5.4 isoform X2 [Nicotiana tabacum]|uniref:Subtilisin-like protease SBT5.4 isoform X2 n=2 Tax=Nicotiana tabacum TaxID=4097 RepID=A0AC58SVU4_TOBAC|nr:PREDICTED: subtilisin-like protease SBT5.4 isoform X2 [Nicotiana tabacum]
MPILQNNASLWRKLKSFISIITTEILSDTTCTNILVMTFRQVILQHLWNFEHVLFIPVAERNKDDHEAPREVFSHSRRFSSRLCKAGALDPKKVKGTILVCLRGDNARVDKGQQDALAGAVGMVPANDYASGDEIIADPHVLPATQISYTDGLELFAYVNSTSTPTAFITHPTTQLGTKPLQSWQPFHQ